MNPFYYRSGHIISQATGCNKYIEHEIFHYAHSTSSVIYNKKVMT